MSYDPVIQDLANYTRRLDQRDARDAWVESGAEDQEKHLTSNPEYFYEVIEALNDDSWFPLETLLLKLVMTNDEEELMDAALELRLLLKNRLQQVALTKAEKAAELEYPGIN